jgi:hypothetical protein
MNAATLRQGIAFAAAHATECEPTDIDQRARCFVAGLGGWLEDSEPALYKAVWHLLDPTNVAVEKIPTTASA